MNYRQRLVQFAASSIVAVGLSILANTTLNASTCQVQCSCVNLLCGGSGCSCSAWNSAWFACGGVFVSNSSGCAWDCGGGEQTSCCNEHCPEEG